MKFVDETQILIRSGHGGAGMVSFKAAKNAPKLGADGGDGGFGGSVYLVGNTQLNTLSSIYYKRLYAAEDGARGGPNGRTGRNGVDMRIPVPLGTLAVDKETGKVLGEVVSDGQEMMLAKGGKRGLGNQRYVSPTHQAPEEHTAGGEGIEISLNLELKLMADCGFAGFPNAGKSTLLSVLSAARPRVADYPFTTLEPQLGVVDLSDCGDYWDRSFVAADIPGLIEGASQGKGLGHEFLRHLERTKVIVYIIDPYSYDQREPLETLEILRNELHSFGDRLSQKRSLVVLTKADLHDDSYNPQQAEAKLRAQGWDVLAISSVARQGIGDLKLRLWDIIAEEKQRIPAEVNDPTPIPQDDKYQLVTSASLESELGI